MTSELKQLANNYLVQTYSQADLEFTSAEGSTLYSSTGRDYVDFTSGIAVNILGHHEPNLLKVLEEASEKPWHLSNLYLNRPNLELAKLLVETSAFADRAHFCLCGASANETAFKFARKYARDKYGEGKDQILAFTNAFHGRLFGSLAATPRPDYQDPFKPLMPGVRFADFNNIDSLLNNLKPDLCAVILEIIQGEGGIYEIKPEFLKTVREYCDQHDIVLIYDEVQSGLARTGKLWAWQNYGVAPDLLTCAKPLANGLPMGVVLAKDKIANVMTARTHGSTFAGGALISSVALGVLRTVSDNSFQSEVLRKSEKIKNILHQAKSKLISEIRGKGLLLGIELKCPVGEFSQLALSKGLLVVSAGNNVIRIIPALNISDAEIEVGMNRFLECLQDLEAKF